MRTDLPAYLLVQWPTASSVRLVSERTSDGAKAVLEEVKGWIQLQVRATGSGGVVLGYSYLPLCLIRGF